MRNAVTGLGWLAVLLAAAIGAMLAIPTGVLCHEEKGLTGTFTTPSYAMSGCPRFVGVEQKTSSLHLRSDEAPSAPNAGPNTGVFNTAIVVPAANDPL